ncbi:MAG: alanine--tRNA ligase, partial [Rhodobiaceae bacterium]|nr:alanine--tRNA ligase [Rhodobiaceae bacterium]
TGDGVRFVVDDTQKRVGDLIVHHGRVEEGVLEIGAELELEVDHGRRGGTRVHHSATHLLHEALRQVLGAHVAQKGSLVEPHRLRFDFSHPKTMSAQELAEVEDITNRIVLQNGEVATRLLPVKDAIAEGAMALFGEKYGDEVRVVTMGRQPGVGGANRAYSMELCGGTHVRRTGDIGLVKIVAESAVAAGVRRIEALAGSDARAYLNEQDSRLRAAAGLLKTTPHELADRLGQLVEERRRLERELGDAKRKLAIGGGGGEDSGIRRIGSANLLTRTLHGISLKELRAIADDGKRQVGSGVVAIVGVSEDGKVGIVVGVTEDLTGTYNAVDLVRLGAEKLGGSGGGGRPDMAQAGGADAAQAQAALDAVEGAIAGRA